MRWTRFGLLFVATGCSLESGLWDDYHRASLKSVSIGIHPQEPWPWGCGKEPMRTDSYRLAVGASATVQAQISVEYKDLFGSGVIENATYTLEATPGDHVTVEAAPFGAGWRVRGLAPGSVDLRARERDETFFVARLRFAAITRLTTERVVSSWPGPPVTEPVPGRLLLGELGSVTLVFRAFAGDEALCGCPPLDVTLDPQPVHEVLANAPLSTSGGDGMSRLLAVAPGVTLSLPAERVAASDITAVAAEIVAADALHPMVVMRAFRAADEVLGTGFVVTNLTPDAAWIHGRNGVDEEIFVEGSYVEVHRIGNATEAHLLVEAAMSSAAPAPVTVRLN